MASIFNWARKAGKTQKIDEVRNRQVVGREADKLRERRSVSEAIKDALGTHAFDKVGSTSTKMAVALNAKNTYAGTVARATVLKRRAANKRARIARRAGRR